jgi:hypothetical protein
MKTLLFAGLAGVLAVAPGAAIAAVDSAPESAALMDLSFASPTAIAASSKGMKAPRAKMGGHKMRGQGMRGHRMKGMKRHGGAKMRHRTVGKNYGQNRGYRKGYRGRRSVGSNFGFFYGGGFPTLGYSQPSYYVQQPTYRYAQPQYYPVPYPVPTPVAYHAPAPTTIVVETVGQKGKGLTKPAARIAAQGHQPVIYDRRILTTDNHVTAGPQTYPGGPVTHSGTTYHGDWDGAYREDGSYQGNWQGTYQDADGRVYEGEYAGTFIGEGGAVPAGANYAHGRPVTREYDDREYDRRYSREQEELAYLQQCRKSSGIGGAVVGGAIGALAGNRIAGRGNRLGGSLIGGGLGAIAGAAIDQGTDRCRKLIKKYGYDRDYADRRVPVQRAPQQAHHGYGYGYGWQGYYQQPAYYQPQPQVTTVVIQSQPVTTTTTTTTVEEEYVYEKPRYVAKKRYKPAKRVWKPRAKPAPVLKGCQQANCYYDQ